MRKFAGIGLLTTLLVALTGCDAIGNLTRRTAPYAVEATLEGRIGDRVVRQTITDRCRIWSTQSLWETYWHAAGSRRPFQLELPGGASLTTAPNIRDICVWTSTPRVGQTWRIATRPDDLTRGSDWNVFWNHADVWIRDQPSDPTRVDRLNATWLGYASDGLRLTSLTIRAIPSAPLPTASVRQPERTFIGVEAFLQETFNTQCQAAAGNAGWRRLDDAPEGEAAGCIPRQNCGDGNPNPCRADRGGLWLEPDARFARLRLRDLNPDRAFQGSYWSRETIRAAGGPVAEQAGAPAWRPDACIEDSCFPLRAEGATVLYDPESHRIITLRPSAIQPPS